MTATDIDYQLKELTMIGLRSKVNSGEIVVDGEEPKMTDNEMSYLVTLTMCMGAPIPMLVGYSAYVDGVGLVTHLFASNCKFYFALKHFLAGDFALSDDGEWELPMKLAGKSIKDLPVALARAFDESTVMIMSYRVVGNVDESRKLAKSILDFQR